MTLVLLVHCQQISIVKKCSSGTLQEHRSLSHKTCASKHKSPAWKNPAPEGQCTINTPDSVAWACRALSAAPQRSVRRPNQCRATQVSYDMWGQNGKSNQPHATCHDAHASISKDQCTNRSLLSWKTWRSSCIET
jgi:hypothetical protein